MASNPNSDATKNSPPSPHDLSNTTYVQADPSDFRAVVQRLTGAANLAIALPIGLRSASNLAIASASEIGYRKKLHERRRQSARKLEINLGARTRGLEKVTMVSPASTLDLFSQETPRSPAAEEEEEKAIAEKGYYFHPITARSSKPELLPLFPLHSPRDDS